MIKVTIELESAVTGATTKIGEMHISNRGINNIRRPELGDYDVTVSRKGSWERSHKFWGRHPRPQDVARKGEVLNYPRLSYNVWRLVAKALKSAFPEEA